MKCGEGTLQYDQNQVFQTLLFALTLADDFYKNFLQKHRPLGTLQKVLSRYKVNKQPKRQRLQESSGNSRNSLQRIMVFDTDAQQTARMYKCFQVRKCRNQQKCSSEAVKPPQTSRKQSTWMWRKLPATLPGLLPKLPARPCLLHRHVEDAFKAHFCGEAPWQRTKGPRGTLGALTPAIKRKYISRWLYRWPPYGGELHGSL